MPLSDPTPERVSACPVHFLWDGRGRGRALVRSGFLGFLAAILLGLAARTVHVELLMSAAAVVAACAAAVYFAGQGASFLARR